MPTLLAPVKRKWVGRKVDKSVMSEVIDKLHVHPVIARILVARHSTLDVDGIECYLQQDGFFDPLLLHGVDKAVERIRSAIENGEHIRVVGDYDVDGVTASAIMVKTLRWLGANPSYYIPNRFTDGYGLSVGMVKQAIEDHVSLLITVDNGISAFEATDYASSQNIDLIITDHHEIGDMLPKAYAIVHPRYPKSFAPEHYLCGAGVSLKLAQALLGEVPDELIELAALGTVCDQMPLQGENRLIVREGLQRMLYRPSLGIKALLSVSGLEVQRITAGHLGFQLGPRINTAGRLQSGEIALALFLTADRNEAYAIAQELDELNQFRKRMQQSMEHEALLQIAENPTWLSRKTLVVSGRGWNEGLVGIIAGRLAERFHKPTLCITELNETAKGSARSIPDFDLYRVLSDVQESHAIFSRWGGHESAAGFSLPTNNIELLRDAFEGAGNEWWHEEIEDAHHLVDAKLRLSDVNVQLIDALRGLEPFGQANPEPVFYVPNVRVVRADTMGKMSEHLRVIVVDERGTSKTLVAFGRGHELEQWEVGSEHELLVTVQENIWNAERRVQLQLVDHRVPSV